MIRSLSKLVVRTAELIEAEGRVARHEVIRMLKITLLYSLASVLVLGAVIALAVGLYTALATLTTIGIAWALVGVLLLACSCAAALIAQRHESL